MSIEFLEPEPAVAPVADAPFAARTRASAVPGRLLGAAGVVGAALAGSAVLAPLYAVDRTALVVDFDGTSTQEAHVVYDAFGHAPTVDLVSPGGGFDGGGALGSLLTVTLPDGISYAPWWLGLAGLLLVAGVWALVRPRSTGPAAAVAALGGVLLGSVGAAWLQIRTVKSDSVAQIFFVARAEVGLWLLVAGGALALLTGVLVATRPPLRRLVRRRRV